MPAEPDDIDADLPRITLLGPQRDPQLDRTVESLGLTGSRFATVTAGWRDREGDDGLLSELLGHRTVNLRLWELMQQLWEADPELDRADRERRSVQTEMQQLYLIGLEQAITALHRIRERQPRSVRVQSLALEDTLQVIRDLDERHCHRITELHEEFYSRHEPQHRPAVLDARFRVGRLIADCDAVVITGGHVGVLMGALHLFNLGPALADGESLGTTRDSRPVVGPRLYRPVIAWGAGAMALTERVLLFYDNSVVMPGVSEALMDGLALTRDLVALPSARDRLDLRDSWRVQSLVRRTAPATCLLLDEGAQVTLTPEGRVPAGAPVLGPDGTARRHPGVAVPHPVGEVLP
jgi:hypothetical protein